MVAERTAKTLSWVEQAQVDTLSIALARTQLYRALLQGKSTECAKEEARQALNNMRAAGQDQEPLRALLTQALLSHTLNKDEDARTHLAEVYQIVSRGSMRLFLADYHLHHARLFRQPEDDPQGHLAEARKIIEECECFRRLPELEDAEKALLPAG